MKAFDSVHKKHLCVSLHQRQGKEGQERIAFVVVQSLSCVWLSETLWTAAHRPHPSPHPGACSSSCPLSRCCHPTISSSVTPFSSCLQSFPASGSFLMSCIFRKDANYMNPNRPTSRDTKYMSNVKERILKVIKRKTKNHVPGNFHKVIG